MADPLAALIEAAEELADCSAGWDDMGYPSRLIYTCLVREKDIAVPDHPTIDWWPHRGPCPNCELRRAIDAVKEAEHA